MSSALIYVLLFAAAPKAANRHKITGVDHE